LFGEQARIDRVADAAAELDGVREFVGPIAAQRGHQQPFAHSQAARQDRHDEAAYRHLFVKQVLLNRSLWVIALVNFCVYIVRYGVLDWAAKFMVERKGYTLAAAAGMAAMMPLFGIKILMYMVMVLIVSAVVSHRMAGPVFKFEKSCSTVGEGDLTHRVYLRKGDQLTDLQDQFNNMAGAMNEVAKEYEKFRVEAAAAGMADKAEALSKKVSEIMPKFNA